MCGTSALAWAEGLSKYHGRKGCVFCVDVWDRWSGLEFQEGQIVARDTVLQVAYDIFSYNIKVARLDDIIFPIIGDSRTALDALRDGYFDIIYIDGHHGYEYVLSDIRNAKRLISDGGIICGDDLEKQVGEVDNIALKAQKDQIAGSDPLSGSPYHPGVTLAVFEEFGTINPFIGLWAVRKAGTEFDSVDLEVLPRVIPSWFPSERVEQARQLLENAVIEQSPGVCSSKGALWRSRSWMAAFAVKKMYYLLRGR